MQPVPRIGAVTAVAAVTAPPPPQPSAPRRKESLFKRTAIPDAGAGAHASALAAADHVAAVVASGRPFPFYLHRRVRELRVEAVGGDDVARLAAVADSGSDDAGAGRRAQARHSPLRFWFGDDEEENDYQAQGSVDDENDRLKDMGWRDPANGDGRRSPLRDAPAREGMNLGVYSFRDQSGNSPTTSTMLPKPEPSSGSSFPSLQVYKAADDPVGSLQVYTAPDTPVERPALRNVLHEPYLPIKVEYSEPRPIPSTNIPSTAIDPSPPSFAAGVTSSASTSPAPAHSLPVYSAAAASERRARTPRDVGGGGGDRATPDSRSASAAAVAAAAGTTLVSGYVAEPVRPSVVAAPPWNVEAHRGVIVMAQDEVDAAAMMPSALGAAPGLPARGFVPPTRPGVIEVSANLGSHLLSPSAAAILAQSSAGGGAGGGSGVDDDWHSGLAVSDVGVVGGGGSGGAYFPGGGPGGGVGGMAGPDRPPAPKRGGGLFKTTRAPATSSSSSALPGKKKDFDSFSMHSKASGDMFGGSSADMFLVGGGGGGPRNKPPMEQILSADALLGGGGGGGGGGGFRKTKKFQQQQSRAASSSPSSFEFSTRSGTAGQTTSSGAFGVVHRHAAPGESEGMPPLLSGGGLTPVTYAFGGGSAAPPPPPPPPPQLSLTPTAEGRPSIPQPAAPVGPQVALTDPALGRHPPRISSATAGSQPLPGTGRLPSREAIDIHLPVPLGSATTAPAAAAAGSAARDKRVPASSTIPTPGLDATTHAVSPGFSDTSSDTDSDGDGDGVASPLRRSEEGDGGLGLDRLWASGYRTAVTVARSRTVAAMEATSARAAATEATTALAALSRPSAPPRAETLAAPPRHGQGPPPPPIPPAAAPMMSSAELMLPPIQVLSTRLSEEVLGRFDLLGSSSGGDEAAMPGLATGFAVAPPRTARSRAGSDTKEPVAVAERDAAPPPPQMPVAASSRTVAAALLPAKPAELAASTTRPLAATSLAQPAAANSGASRRPSQDWLQVGGGGAALPPARPVSPFAPALPYSLDEALPPLAQQSQPSQPVPPVRQAFTGHLQEHHQEQQQELQQQQQQQRQRLQGEVAGSWPSPSQPQRHPDTPPASVAAVHVPAAGYLHPGLSTFQTQPQPQRQQQQLGPQQVLHGGGAAVPSGGRQPPSQQGVVVSPALAKHVSPLSGMYGAIDRANGGGGNASMRRRSSPDAPSPLAYGQPRPPATPAILHVPGLCTAASGATPPSVAAMQCCGARVCVECLQRWLVEHGAAARRMFPCPACSTLLAMS